MPRRYHEKQSTPNAISFFNSTISLTTSSAVSTLYTRTRSDRFSRARRILDTSKVRDQYKKSVRHAAKRLFFGLSTASATGMRLDRPRRGLLALTVFLLFYPLRLVAQPGELCSDTDFSIVFAEDWKPVEVTQPGVICAFRSGNGFPTFNVIRIPGPYPEASLSLAAQGSRLVESYKTAGITDTQLSCIENRNVNGIPLVIAAFTYSNQGSAMSSRIAIASSNEWHYLATEVQSSSGGGLSCETKGTVLEGLKLQTKPTDLKSQRDMPLTTIGLIVGLLILVFGTLHYRKRLTRR